jgi:CRP-like cAMP-binding protein
MSATLHRLVSRREKLTEADSLQLRRLVLDYEGLPERLRGELVAEIDRRTASRNGWTFVMLSPAENAAVVDWLVQNSKRPFVALRLWAKLFDNLRTDTGEIVLTRDELAERVNETPDNVSTIMGELESIGAISRRRERVAGMRGPGMVRYFMNPRVGTHLTGKTRDQAQKSAPPLLSLMEGGKVTPKG